MLQEVIKQKKRRLHIEQWLLLLVRIALPIVLALCLARPVLTALRQLPGFGKTSLVVLLDVPFATVGGVFAKGEPPTIGSPHAARSTRAVRRRARRRARRPRARKRAG